MGKHTIAAFSDSAVFGALDKGPAVQYLVGYLTELKAESFVVESHYVDRHFLDDFAHYYARSFRAPSPRCGRLHFFTLPGERLEELLSAVYDAKSEEARAIPTKELQAGYLGFVVKRPLGGATMGRTVLQTYPVENRRHYAALRPYRVNIGSVQLAVDGLAYQQQDGGAAVCASTALWSALQRVAFVAGHRTPTPSAITEAAKSPFPASVGLTELQMATALSNLGYIADAFSPDPSPLLFRMKLVTYLQSQLPVVLLVKRKRMTSAGEAEEGHAVTVTGYSEPTSIVTVPAPVDTDYKLAPIHSRFGAAEIIYVHDDNLGSHAHYELWNDVRDDEPTKHRVMLKRGRSTNPKPDWWKVDDWVVELALVPKPPKLRVDAESLFLNLLFLRPLIERDMLPGLPLHYEMRFTSGVEFKREMLDTDLDKVALRDFAEGVVLPRHVGIVSVLVGTISLFEFVIDVSEYDRHEKLPPVLGVVAPGIPNPSRALARIQRVAAKFAWPLVQAAPAASPPPP